MKDAKRERQKLIVLLADLGEHVFREVCFGAAEYIAGRPNLNFEPWPMSAKDGAHPQAADFASVDGLLTTEREPQQIFGSGPIKIPHVYVLTSKRGFRPLVGLDEEKIGRMAAAHLLDRGHVHLVGFSIHGMEWSKGRIEGFEAECRERNITPRHLRFAVEDLPTFWTSKIARRREKLARTLEQLPKPCGIFAANDVMAFFVKETAQACGFKVPSDIAVIGADDDPVPNAAAGLAISSIQPPFREIGRQAAWLLEARLGQPNIKERILLPPIKTVVRASTDEFSIADPLMRRAQHYIEKRRRDAIRVTDVSRALHTSTVTLAKYFRRYLQMTPAAYVLSRRIEDAKELLREGRYNVQEVSEICRFHSCSYFCKVFRQMTGATPNRIRKEIRPTITGLNHLGYENSINKNSF